MNSTLTNTTDWTGSEMYQTMNASGGCVMTGLSDLASVVTPVPKVSTRYASGSWASETSTDTFWLMSYSELFGENKGWIPKYYKNEGSQYDWCTTNVTNCNGANAAITSMDKTRSGSIPAGYIYPGWFERSPRVDATDTRTFNIVYTDSKPGNYGYYREANRWYGIVPAFSL